MEVEYHLVPRHEPFTEDELNDLGSEGWHLAAIVTTVEQVEVAYNVHRPEAILQYHFWRERDE